MTGIPYSEAISLIHNQCDWALRTGTVTTTTCALKQCPFPGKHSRRTIYRHCTNRDCHVAYKASFCFALLGDFTTASGTVWARAASHNEDCGGNARKVLDPHSRARVRQVFTDNPSVPPSVVATRHMLPLVPLQRVKRALAERPENRAATVGHVRDAIAGLHDRLRACDPLLDVDDGLSEHAPYLAWCLPTNIRYVLGWNPAGRVDLVVDHTYKLTSVHWPVLNVGLHDAAGRMHVIGGAMVRHEDAATTIRVLTLIRKHLPTVHTVITDGALAFGIAFANVYPSAAHRMCLFHVFYSVKKQVGATAFKTVLPGLRALAAARTEEEFAVRFEAVASTWTPECVRYVRTQWLNPAAFTSRWMTWTTGVGLPRTTSAMESLHRVQKVVTRRKLCTIPQLLIELVSLAQQVQQREPPVPVRVPDERVIEVLLQRDKITQSTADPNAWECPSATTPGLLYHVDTEKKTCECIQWSIRKICKHMHAVDVVRKVIADPATGVGGKARGQGRPKKVGPKYELK